MIDALRARADAYANRTPAYLQVRPGLTLHCRAVDGVYQYALRDVRAGRITPISEAAAERIAAALTSERRGLPSRTALEEMLRRYAPPAGLRFCAICGALCTLEARWDWCLACDRRQHRAAWADFRSPDAFRSWLSLSATTGLKA